VAKIWKRGRTGGSTASTRASRSSCRRTARRPRRLSTTWRPRRTTTSRRATCPPSGSSPSCTWPSPSRPRVKRRTASCAGITAPSAATCPWSASWPTTWPARRKLWAGVAALSSQGEPSAGTPGRW